MSTLNVYAEPFFCLNPFAKEFKPPTMLNPLAISFSPNEKILPKQVLFDGWQSPTLDDDTLKMIQCESKAFFQFAEIKGDLVNFDDIINQHIKATSMTKGDIDEEISKYDDFSLKLEFKAQSILFGKNDKLHMMMMMKIAFEWSCSRNNINIISIVKTLSKFTLTKITSRKENIQYNMVRDNLEDMCITDAVRTKDYSSDECRSTSITSEKLNNCIATKESASSRINSLMKRWPRLKNIWSGLKSKIFSCVAQNIIH